MKKRMKGREERFTRGRRCKTRRREKWSEAIRVSERQGADSSGWERKERRERG